MERAREEGAPAESFRRRRQRRTILTLLGIGYAGFYLCRVIFSVARPLLIRELQRAGWSETEAILTLGTIASWSLLASAAGKLVAGPLADTIGGRRTFLAGMALVTCSTLAFGWGVGPGVWLVTWCLQRLVQPLGWPGLLKIVAHWTPASSLGTALGVLSLSWLAGDAAARAFYGALFAHGVSWRHACFLAAALLALLCVVSACLLRDAPAGASGDPPSHPPAQGIGALLRPLLRMPSFWLLCLLSLALTLVREALMEWTPTYLSQGGRLSIGEAAQRSALFPLLGSVSAVATGWLGDRLDRAGRGWLLTLGTVSTAGLLLALSVTPAGRTGLATLWIALLGLALIGPYAFVVSHIPMELGGADRGASASGLVDAIGSLGAILAGRWVAEIAVRLGWSGAFQVLAGLAAAGALAAFAFSLARAGADRRI